MKPNQTPQDIRLACRNGLLQTPTSGLALGFVQANLVIIPAEMAFEFLLFCFRNPKSCPLLDVTEAGDPEPKLIAPGADIRTDLPKYRVFRNGVVVDEPSDILTYWRDDLVGFLLGCSFTFERALLNAGLPIRNIEQGVNVPMYRTSLPCVPAGRFAGNMVVSMRPMTMAQAIQATHITGRYPRAHGTPVHIGDPREIGINDSAAPDFGDPVEIKAGEVPVFWACGVTPQAVITAVQPEFAITHAPGHMFVSDLKDDELMN